jgi:hypothetical protein
MIIASMPGAWYDLAGRVDILKSIASCALETVPCGDGNQEHGNHAANLIAAMQDILRLMEQDVNFITEELRL